MDELRESRLPYSTERGEIWNRSLNDFLRPMVDWIAESAKHTSRHTRERTRPGVRRNGVRAIRLATYPLIIEERSDEPESGK